jgi:uncharacterized protein
MVQVYPSDRAVAGLVLAHGAGGGQQSRFMVLAAGELAARGIVTATFDFPYMAQGRSVPDKAPVLETAWRAAIDETRAHPSFTGLPLFIGGKSMGGRIASQVAAAGVDVAGLVLLGYPLHPPGQLEKLRTKHLPAIKVPMLFVQGSRDAFGTPDELRPVLDRLTAPADLCVVEGGDHSYKVPKKLMPQEQVFEFVLDEVDRWLRRRV